MSELAFVDWLRQQTPNAARVAVGIGDDAAVVNWPPGPPLVVTTDMLLEGSCFAREARPRLIGRKALAVNLSDLAAMAAKPVAAVISVGLPRDTTTEFAQELYLGIQELAAEFDVALVGGDTNSWKGPLVINITLFGEPTGSGPVLRSGAEPGDWLFVTGPLGGSIYGHHLTFTPRVKEAMALHQRVKLKAMMDISDGLALDLRRLCKESNCGAVLDEAAIPIASAAYEHADNRAPLDHALGDGEDFELLFAVAPSDGELLLRSANKSTFRIGTVQATGLRLRAPDGTERELPNVGYEHRFAPSAPLR